MISELLYGCALALTVSLFSSYFGFKRLAESIVAGYFSLTGRKQYLKLSNELQSLKDQQSKLSAIDNFAQWAKLNRQITNKQKTFESEYSRYSFSKLKLEFALAILARVVVYTGVFVFLWYLQRRGVMNRMVASSLASDGTERWILRVVYGNGALGLFRWFVLCNFAFSVL